MGTRQDRNMRGIRGYSLVEMLMYVAVAGVGINLCAGLFVTGARMSALGTETLDRMNGMAELRTVFTETVREAVAVAPRVGDYRTGKDQLVLRKASKDGLPRYIVLGRIRDKVRMSRLDLVVRGGELEATRLVTHRQALGSFRFAYDADNPAQARCVTLRCGVLLEPGESTKRRRPQHFTAALRGFHQGPIWPGDAP